MLQDIDIVKKVRVRIYDFLGFVTGLLKWLDRLEDWAAPCSSAGLHQQPSPI